MITGSIIVKLLTKFIQSEKTLPKNDNGVTYSWPRVLGYVTGLIMKLYLLLILSAVSTAFLTGYLALSLQRSHSPSDQDLNEINFLKVQFQRFVSPQYILNLNSIYPRPEQLKLLDPLFTLTEWDAKNVTSFSSAKDCFNLIDPISLAFGDPKPLVWENYRCGRRTFLPLDFFSSAPFIHPSGKSYAYLAFELSKDGQGHREWALNHLPFFHVMELPELKNRIGELYGPFKVLVKLDETSLTSLSRGKGTVLTKDFLIARLKYGEDKHLLEYRFYMRWHLQDFLSDGPYVLQNFGKGRYCFYRDGNLCWNLSTRHLFLLANKSIVIILGGLIIIVIAVVRLLLGKLKEQKLEDERQRLALRVLTHEFRTPITSLLLLNEKLGNQYMNMNDEMQETALKISSETYRLKNLVDSSRHYLRSRQDSRLIEFHWTHVDSYNRYFGDMLNSFQDHYGDQLKFIPLENDGAGAIDDYWLGICVKNLIENGFTHGRLPVTLSLAIVSGRLHIMIEDCGQVQFNNLKEMIPEFVKGSQSPGTGLGLNIVAKIIKEMGGQFIFEKNPTRFTLILSKKERKNEQSAIG